MVTETEGWPVPLPAAASSATLCPQPVLVVKSAVSAETYAEAEVNNNL